MRLVITDTPCQGGSNVTVEGLATSDEMLAAMEALICAYTETSRISGASPADTTYRLLAALAEMVARGQRPGDGSTIMEIPRKRR